MRYPILLIGCYTTGTVTAYYADLSVSGMSPVLVARTNHRDNHLSSFRLQRRTGGTGRGSKAATPPSSSQQTKSDSNQFGKLPSAKASLRGNGKVDADQGQILQDQGRATNHEKAVIVSDNPHKPYASAESYKRPVESARWPAKAFATGTSVTATTRASDGPSHMLLTAPDRAPRHVHVPKGHTGVAGMESDIPGAAKAYVVGRPDAITYASGRNGPRVTWPEGRSKDWASITPHLKTPTSNTDPSKVPVILEPGSMRKSPDEPVSPISNSEEPKHE